jgi:hypothetical protein
MATPPESGRFLKKAAQKLATGYRKEKEVAAF